LCNVIIINDLSVHMMMYSLVQGNMKKSQAGKKVLSVQLRKCSLLHVGTSKITCFPRRCKYT